MQRPISRLVKHQRYELLLKQLPFSNIWKEKMLLKLVHSWQKFNRIFQNLSRIWLPVHLFKCECQVYGRSRVLRFCGFEFGKDFICFFSISKSHCAICGDDRKEVGTRLSPAHLACRILLCSEPILLLHPFDKLCVTVHEYLVGDSILWFFRIFVCHYVKVVCFLIL